MQLPISEEILTCILSCNAPSPNYSKLFVKFSLSTEEYLCLMHLFGVNSHDYEIKHRGNNTVSYYESILRYFEPLKIPRYSVTEGQIEGRTEGTAFSYSAI